MKETFIIELELIVLTAGLDLELAKAAQILVKDMIKVKPGEDILIYADTESDMRTVEETSKAVHSVGGRVATVRYPAPRGVGEAADLDIPTPLGAAMSNCDIMIEFSSKYLLYSTPWRKAMETRRVRYLCLSGMTAEMMYVASVALIYPHSPAFRKRLQSSLKKLSE